MEEKCLLDPGMDCRGLIKADEIEKDMKILKRDIEDIRMHNEQSHKEFYDRLARLEVHNEVQDVHYEHILEKLTDITDKLSSVSTRISALEFKPAKKWEDVAGKILWLVIAAVVGLAFAKIGLQ